MRLQKLAGALAPVAPERCDQPPPFPPRDFGVHLGDPLPRLLKQSEKVFDQMLGRCSCSQRLCPAVYGTIGRRKGQLD